MEEAGVDDNEDVDNCEMTNAGTVAADGADAEAGAAEAIVAVEVAAA